MSISDENDAGASYLAALKQSTAQSAGAAPARDNDPGRSAETRTSSLVPPSTADSTASIPRVEHRKSPRYKCKGDARLQQISTTVSAWAKFSDISAHGCYVETAAPYRPGTLLGLKLDARGFRIEATGEVRVVYPGLGMGISFNQMSDANREQLRELLRSISQPSVILESRRPEQLVSKPQSDPPPSVVDPGAALQAMMQFFEDRHMMGREEFLRILRKH